MAHPLEEAIDVIIRRLPTDAPVYDTLRFKLLPIQKAASAVLALAARPDPMKSAAANALVLNAEKARLRQLVGDARPALHNTIGDYGRTQEAARVARANLKPDDHAAEIRNIFRSLSRADKQRFITDAIKENAASVVAAIVTVPTALTGLTTEEATRYREMYLERAAPSSQDAVEEMRAAADTVLLSAEKIATP